MTAYFVKYLNLLSSGTSFLFSSVTGRQFVSGMPPAISFELTNYCNLRCPECLTGSGLMTRPKGFMDPDLFERIINELGKYLHIISLYFQGEPMMHPEFFRFIESLGGIKAIVSTNGHLLSEEKSRELANSGLYKLVVSLDGMDITSYSVYRINGDFEKVIDGIKNISAAIKQTGSKLKLEIQFLVNRYNEYQITEARSFAKEVNASLKLKSMQIIRSDNAENWLPQNPRFRRYKDNSGDIVKHRLPDRCARLWFNPVITWDGKVIPCCFDKDAEFIMGDLNNDSFRQIWYSDRYVRFRNRILSGRNAIAMCRNCTSGLNGVKY